MKKILHVARRELAATVLTKGFILGILLPPFLMAFILIVIPRLLKEEAPKIDGEVAIVDTSKGVVEGVLSRLAPEAIARRRAALMDEIKGDLPGGVRALAEVSGKDAAFDQALGAVPELTVVELALDANIESEKTLLLRGEERQGNRIALAVIAENAVEPDGGGAYGAYRLFISEKLDDRIIDEIESAIRQSIIEARLRTRGLDPEDVAALTRVPRIKPRAVTEAGEHENTEILNELLPPAFMILLFISTLTAGQYLMTTTIEEKSSRVVELLLSAVSPMELMTGKILGQLTVGLVALTLYGGMGVIALVSFSLFGLIDPMLLVYLFIFYLIAYFVFGSCMAAIGAAVNEMREAQTLVMPVMLCFMIPWILSMPISRDPNSLFATIMSMVPPINAFAMLLRMTSTMPPPLWQVWLSIAIGVVSVYFALRMAAKVFRIGILMHGKPPNFATLIRWLRMA